MVDKKKTHVRHALLVGCGNIGGALLKLWASLDIFSEIIVVQPSLAFAEDFACYDSIEFVNDVKNIPSDFIPDVVVLAIKPQIADVVIPDLRPYIISIAEPTISEDFLGQRDVGSNCDKTHVLQAPTTKIPDRGRLCRDALVVSALAGTSLDKLALLTSEDCRIVRIMPTIAIKTSQSVNLAFANENVSVADIETMEKIIGLSGEITWVREENHLDILTPISGSGPAYFFLLAEILVEETVKLGIDEDTARQIVQGTLVGSASLVSDNSDFAGLRKSVTSRKGVTEAALEIMSSGMRNVMEESLKAATQRLEELRK
ncbi:pyrroline-5-carboxylate reductase [Alphaproteobacteria bacterium]|nr:pyrroline-5-carboxylate reductase [Alphaproteobacteria bacterium]